MRIYRMTATFGKLEHQTLELKPGLNIITAPNEWGKSTWCAFLVAMLYGIDTRSKTTKNSLADKDRYAPWSGLPMEGRIDLNWQGRDITIERKTTRRIPMGDFSAYETKSGIPVPELTAANCGLQLLGVEQTVFRRAGFIRHADLPVTSDESLRRRLNALVTTGDDSGDADRLAQTLKDLRNKCRYNRSGLLPQAENERDALEGKLTELETLNTQCQTLKLRVDEVKRWIDQLKNHRQALDYAAAQSHAERVAAARDTLDDANRELSRLEAACAALPSQEYSRQNSAKLRSLLEEQRQLQLELQSLPEAPQPPMAPEAFEDMSMEEARKMLHRDTQEYIAAKRTGAAIVLVVMGVLGLVSSGLLVFLRSYIFAAIAGVGSVAALVWGTVELVSMGKKTRSLRQKYGTSDQTRWALPLSEYEKQLKQYLAQLKTHKESSGKLQFRLSDLQAELGQLCSGQEPKTVLDMLDRAVISWDACHSARREAARAQEHFDALSAMTKPVHKPAQPDTLTQSEADTDRLLSDCAAEQQRLQNRLSQYRGRMDILGDKALLQNQLTRKVRQIARLEQTYAALVIAQETLSQAREELQRRFAPRITRRAQQLLKEMTGGRYSTVTMDTEFSLRAAAEQEDTLRDILWRSDGTVDQLYLALRLAVAEELTPQAPLILDDALVRFDDSRMKAAVAILDKISRNKQVIVFSCQGREELR